MPTRTIKLDSVMPRIILLILLIMCLVFLVFGIKWMLGNTISTQAATKDVAELAIGLAPNDPKTHFALANVNERSFLPEDGPKSLAGFEKAVSLSPYDYRLWLALGKSRERSGDVEAAEKDLKRAMDLAPSYAQVKWAFGNLLLRRGKTDEAFRMIRNAVDNDPKFASPAATTAWQIFDGDIEKVKKTIGDSAQVKSSLALFLAKEGKFEDAFEIWKTLPASGLKTDFKQDSERILQYFLNGQKYKMAFAIKSQLTDKNKAAVKFEQITNGGFESDVRTDQPELFDWEIAAGAVPQINLARDQKHGGSQSLLINFNITKREEFRTISQTVAVESGKDYVLEIFYKSDVNVKETVKWEVVDAISQTVISASDPLPQNADWQKMEVAFTAPEASQGVIVRLIREGCESVICPINGKIWFDDISLK
ncbi:MAG: hypothetical protein R2681_16610 [Pyrinomonadaceae bacterium]